MPNRADSPESCYPSLGHLQINDRDPAPPKQIKQYKLIPPKPYTMGDNFKTFRLILLNYMKDATELEQQKSILLSLLEPKIFELAYPIVSRGSHIMWILDELQSLLSPDEELSTKLTQFQSLAQLPGESVSQFAIRVTAKGRDVHPTLEGPHLQAYLVPQFISGLRDAQLKNMIRLLGPESIQKAVALVKRSSEGETNPIVSVVEAKEKPKLVCQLCTNLGHTAQQCRKFKVAQRKANPKGFNATYPRPPQQYQQNIQRQPQPNYWRNPSNMRFPQQFNSRFANFNSSNKFNPNFNNEYNRQPKNGYGRY